MLWFSHVELLIPVVVCDVIRNHSLHVGISQAPWLHLLSPSRSEISRKRNKCGFEALRSCCVGWCSFGSTHFACIVTERMALNSSALLCKNRQINQWTGNSCTNSSPGNCQHETIPNSSLEPSAKTLTHTRIKVKSSTFTEFRSIIKLILNWDFTFPYTHRVYMQPSFPAQSLPKCSVYPSEEQKEISFCFSS